MAILNFIRSAWAKILEAPLWVFRAVITGRTRTKLLCAKSARLEEPARALEDNGEDNGITDEHLKEPEIINSGYQLNLGPHAVSHAAETDSIGEDQLWSSDGLYKHLCFLEGLVPLMNESADRLLINAFFFRAASMLMSMPQPDDSDIVLCVEQNTAPTSQNKTSVKSASGFVNFKAVLTIPGEARNLLFGSTLPDLCKHASVFCVPETKRPNRILAAHLQQAVCEMYSCAENLKKDIIRGALTNGSEWMFIILKINENGNGGTFTNSSSMGFHVMPEESTKPSISKMHTSLLAAIIAHWILHSHEDIDEGDFFTVD